MRNNEKVLSTPYIRILGQSENPFDSSENLINPSQPSNGAVLHNLVAISSAEAYLKLRLASACMSTGYGVITSKSTRDDLQISDVLCGIAMGGVVV
jgi:hypothetical protein